MKKAQRMKYNLFYHKLKTYNTPNTNHIMALSLAGRRCVITGGASGLGKATAARFARNGAQVVILDLPSSDGTAVANELGDNVFFSPTDVTSESDVNAALDLCESEFGAPVNVAVNCAGIGVVSFFLCVFLCFFYFLFVCLLVG